MTWLQLVLVLTATVMVIREVLKVALLAGRVVVRFRLSYWIHMGATIALVLAAVVSFVGVRP